MAEFFRVCAYDASGRWRWLEQGPGPFVQDGFVVDAEVAAMAALEVRGYPRVLVVDGEDAIAVEVEDGRCTWPPELAEVCRENGLDVVAAALRRRLGERTLRVSHAPGDG
jgi:hypothetical protein